MSFTASAIRASTNGDAAFVRTTTEACPASRRCASRRWRSSRSFHVSPQPDSLIRLTRGLGMARSGDLAGAKGEIEAIKALRAALERSNQSYWADRSEEQVLALSAWIALKEAAREQATNLMRAAADGEDGSVKHV